MSKPNWLNYSSFTNNTIISSLDIGSSKVCCLIGKLDSKKKISFLKVILSSFKKKAYVVTINYQLL